MSSVYYQNTSVRDVLMEIASTVCYDPYDVIGFGLSLGFLDHEVKDLLLVNPTSISNAMYQLLSHFLKEMCHGDENYFISKLVEAASFIRRTSALQEILERLHSDDHKIRRKERQVLNRALYVLAQLTVEKVVSGSGITQLMDVLYTPAQLKMFNWPNVDARLLIFCKFEEMSYRVNDVKKYIFECFQNAGLVPEYHLMCKEKELSTLVYNDEENRKQRQRNTATTTTTTARGRKRALKLPSSSSSCSTDDDDDDDDDDLSEFCHRGNKISFRPRAGGKIPRRQQQQYRRHRSPASPLVPPPPPPPPPAPSSSPSLLNKDIMIGCGGSDRNRESGQQQQREESSFTSRFDQLVQNQDAMDELTVLVNNLK